MRWDPYILAQPDGFGAFWKEHLARGQRDVLMILGRGFDVRACDVAQQIFAAAGAGRRHVWMLCFDNGLPSSPQHQQMAAANEATYRNLFKSCNIQELKIALGGINEPTTTPGNTNRTLSDKTSRTSLQAYDDVILDVSAMPRMVALTAIAKLIALLDGIALRTGKQVNFHVATAESVTSDLQAAGDSPIDAVTMVYGFSGNKNAESDDFMPRVWFPILGVCAAENPAWEDFQGQEDRV